MTEDLQKDQTPAPVSFIEALLYWLKLGFISFGGPAGQISMMHQELVEKRRWISEHRFLHALNYTMVLPGPEAQQLATYIGWLMHGTFGGIIAGILFVLPSLIILSVLTWVYLVYGDVTAVAGILFGIKPAVTAIVVFAAYRIGSRALKNAVLWGMAAMAFIAIFFFEIPFPYIVVAAALIGFIGSKFAPSKFVAGAGHGASNSEFGRAIIDDDTPIPAHAKFNLVRFIIYCVIGLLLWILVWWSLTGELKVMSEFFTKAAMVTFGGAYAVLPYVYQGAVEHYEWLTPTQMIDGLALGETTPGPLIMIVSFVGFVGGWTKEILGAGGSLFFAGFAGASVATYFTFLPSFLFILLGGPFVEATRNDLKFTAPLTGITAAVVGVILNLAMFFAYHVMWPNGMGKEYENIGQIEWFAVVVCLLSIIALFRFKVGMMTLIAATGVIGLIYSLII